ncbi:MAG: hypothetical protein RLZZ511_340 [Cyanobacteriota bacterium]|jgi:hypothetical protein
MAGFWVKRNGFGRVGAIAMLIAGVAPAEAAMTDGLNQHLQQLHNKMDQAANARDRDSLLQFYGLEFTNNDGLNRETLSQSVRQLWQQYPQLTYRTEVLQASPQGQGTDVETLMRITGDQEQDGRTLKVDITLRSRQRWQDDKLVQQEILSEQTRLTIGERPPTVTINLPETVKVGERYTYEAIVQEPLDGDILMGEILDQPVTANQFTQPKPLQLELPTVLELVGNRNFIRLNRPDPKMQSVNLKRLRAGGFFKSAQAPKAPENRWLSAVLMRHDAGLTIVTQRLRVVE